MDKQDKFTGALVGCAIGDALGAPLEGQSREAIAELDGLTQAFRPFYAKKAATPYPSGQCTDDTQLTLAIVRGMLKAGTVDGVAIAAEFVRLWESGEIVGSGPVANHAVDRLMQGVSWDEAALADDPPLNGAAMRIAPIGLWDHDRPEQLAEDVSVASVITHRHPQGVSGALAIAAAVAYVVAEENFTTREFLASVAGAVDGQDPELAAHIGLVGEWDALPETTALETLVSVSGQGSHRRKNGFGISVMVEPTVLMALYAFIKSPDDYLATVERAIRAGGDVDTTAAIAGAISGAYNGVSSLPSGLAGSVKDSEEIHALGEQLYRAWAAR